MIFFFPKISDTYPYKWWFENLIEGTVIFSFHIKFGIQTPAKSINSIRTDGNDNNIPNIVYVTILPSLTNQVFAKNQNLPILIRKIIT